MILAGVTSGEEGDVEEEEGGGKDGEEEAERINDQIMKHSTPLYYYCTSPFSISTLSLVQSRPTILLSEHGIEGSTFLSDQAALIKQLFTTGSCMCNLVHLAHTLQNMTSFNISNNQPIRSTVTHAIVIQYRTSCCRSLATYHYHFAVVHECTVFSSHCCNNTET